MEKKISISIKIENLGKQSKGGKQETFPLKQFSLSKQQHHMNVF